MVGKVKTYVLGSWGKWVSKCQLKWLLTFHKVLSVQFFFKTDMKSLDGMGYLSIYHIIFKNAFRKTTIVSALEGYIQWNTQQNCRCRTVRCLVFFIMMSHMHKIYTKVDHDRTETMGLCRETDFFKIYYRICLGYSFRKRERGSTWHLH